MGCRSVVRRSGADIIEARMRLGSGRCGQPARLAEETDRPINGDRPWRGVWRVLSAALLAVQVVAALPARAGATAGPCLPSAAPPALDAAPFDPRAADLPAPFNARPWDTDRDELLAEAQDRVARQLASIDAPDCFAAKLPDIATRTALLSPLEFLIVSLYDDPGIRATLLQTYRSDPHEAYRQLLPVWPSPRAELALQSRAFYDIDANQIFVNTRAVPPAVALNVVVHEFWHALANVRYEELPDGTRRRVTGFWMEELPPGGRVWHQIDERLAGGVPTYLLNEAVAVEMEVAATGREPPDQRPDLSEARETLRALFRAAGRERVLELYLESRRDELQELSRQVAQFVES